MSKDMDWRAEARAACAAATEGPWIAKSLRQEGQFRIEIGSLYAFGLIGEDNACFIALARTAFPRALDALDKADALAAEVEKFGRIHMFPSKLTNALSAFRKTLIDD